MMGYQNAIRQFEENVRLVDRTREPLWFNLNQGLLNLTEVLNQDLINIQNELRVIRAVLEKISSYR